MMAFLIDGIEAKVDRRVQPLQPPQARDLADGWR
jgi:hypothetical protein